MLQWLRCSSCSLPTLTGAVVPATRYSFTSCVHRPARCPVLRTDAATQPHLFHRGAPGPPPWRRREPAPPTPLPSAWGREQARQCRSPEPRTSQHHKCRAVASCFSARVPPSITSRPCGGGKLTPKNWNRLLVARRPVSVPRGESVVRLRLGRRLVTLLPVVPLTETLTNGIIGRTWVVGVEFESHVHHEKCFVKKTTFLMSRI